MKTALRVVAVLVVLLVLLVGVTYAWASRSTSQALKRTYAAHSVEFPVPLPDSAGEVSAGDSMAVRGGSAAAGEELERARERGRHLVEARYACGECHGADFGGGVMVDDPLIGRLLGPNLTTGRGSVTSAYTPADWDRIVRHGIKPNGRAAVMPSIDFVRMSDQELSDIVAYIRSHPAVDREVPAVKTGPLAKVLVATGQIRLSAEEIGTHDTPHRRYPPASEATEEFGVHLGGTCTGCHRADLSGGPIAGGDPSWPPAANLTPHVEGLGGWSYEDFRTALREGTRPDGSALLAPMDGVVAFTRRMTDVEVEALWRYLQSLPAKADGS